MSDSQVIDRRVLSEAFQEAMQGWRLRAAVFLTFRFDPGFFEQEVLPVFFDIPLSHAPTARVLHLADVLRVTGPIAVYYDRRGIEPGAAPARTDFQKIGVTQTTGYFHPKNVLLLLESVSPESEWQSTHRPQRLLVGAMSANLTRAGWWENVEVAHIETAEEGTPCGFRDDLLALVALLRRVAPEGTSHDALEEIHAFARKCEQDQKRLSQGSLNPRLYTNTGYLPDYLDELAGARIRNRYLEIISPYFDTNESLKPLKELITRFRPKQIRVFLPRGAAGEALCSEHYWKELRELGASWAELPDEAVRLAKGTSRFVHAKVYRFFDTSDRRQTFFIGSANLTNAGFESRGNVETGFVVEVEGKRKSEWWLELEDKKPVAFAGRSEDDGIEVGPGSDLVLRFDWRTSQLLAFWDHTAVSPTLALRGSGVALGVINPLSPRIATVVDSSIAPKMQEHLVSSSFVTVLVEGEAEAVIVVEELSATDKPSLLSTITPEEILRYWSLLTDAQKQEFLETHAGDLDDDQKAWIGTGVNVGDPTDGIFGTFAHIYLSFGSLERTVRFALREGRLKEAVDRLFSKKFDSVRRLVEKISEKSEKDPVRDYITLLCAVQLLESLKKEEPDFYSKERERFELTVLARSSLVPIKETFSFGTVTERESFLDWFEQWFLRRATPEYMERPT